MPDSRKCSPDTARTSEAANLYLHFPFCRRKCAYCALHSRPGSPVQERASYASRIAREIRSALARREKPLATIYCGGGSPAMCDLADVFAALAPFITAETEFTVELHPLDATTQTLDSLAAGGVNRISMGVQSLDDAVLRAMGRGYTINDAFKAFAAIRRYFANAGIDLIVGWPDDTSNYSDLASWHLEHCSAYSLILEEGTALAALVKRRRVVLPDDEDVMDHIGCLADSLKAIGLERYEISNYARPGRECRHNLATWRGEDYIGIGEGAAGRLGLVRTLSGETVDTLSPQKDRLERTLFRLRTRDGLDASEHPEWRDTLERFKTDGLLRGDFPHYALTRRGTEVCDAILAELV